jgi:hypothetical protein
MKAFQPYYNHAMCESAFTKAAVCSVLQYTTKNNKNWLINADIAEIASKWWATAITTLSKPL